MKLKCFICSHIVGEFRDPKIPLMGAMFTSPDPHHGFPDPFPPVVTWKHMFCPMCQRRPFPEPDQDGNITLLTEVGKALVTPGGVKMEVSPVLLEEVREGTGEAIEDEKAPEVEEAANVQGVAEESAPVYTEDPIAVETMRGGTTTAILARLMDNGAVVKNGPWFEYGGNKYRKADLYKMISNG